MDSADATAGDARTLAVDLAARDDRALVALLRVRSVSATAPWRDWFDAAEALLEPAGVDRALSLLPRAALRALAGRAAPTPGDLTVARAEALIRPDGAPYRVVRGRAEALAAEHPDAFAPTAASPAPAPASAHESASAAEHAALGIAALADLLVHMRDTPLARTGAGAVVAADRRALMEEGVVASAGELDELLHSADAAGLARPVGRQWLATSSGEEWLAAPTTQRWRAVVLGLRASLPAALRTSDGGILPAADWPGAYPLDPSWPARQKRLVALLLRWGLVTASGTEPDWARTLRQGGDADTAGFAREIPPETDRIYLQADLSAIAPGALAPALDLRLRRMAVRESRAQASTYRFTESSLAAAIAGGETAESVRGFLAGLSLTGIPQPLDYLLERVAERHGRVQVGADAGTGRTFVSSQDDTLLETLLVDQSVRALGLVRDGDRLWSRVGRDAVYWTLVAARYPAVAVDGAGLATPARRQPLASEVADEAGGGADAYGRLLATLRATPAGDSDAAWLVRELEAAVRARAGIVVSVVLPDGSAREFTLEATGFGGGRLRGRDRSADTERTIPVASIRGIRPA